MRVAVTGGSGKLGRHVVRRLTGDGHQVLNLDRAGERNPRLVVVDLARLPANQRIVTFILLGVLLLAISYIYTRVRDRRE